MKSLCESIFDDEQSYVDKSGWVDFDSIKTIDDFRNMVQGFDLEPTPQEIKRIYKDIKSQKSDLADLREGGVIYDTQVVPILHRRSFLMSAETKEHDEFFDFRFLIDTSGFDSICYTNLFDQVDLMSSPTFKKWAQKVDKFMKKQGDFRIHEIGNSFYSSIYFNKKNKQKK